MAVTMSPCPTPPPCFSCTQLDKLRTIIENMLSSSSTLLSMSMVPHKPQTTLAPGQIDPEATCPACSLDLGHQVSLLVQRYEQLQDMVNNLIASRPAKKAKLQSQVGLCSLHQHVLDRTPPGDSHPPGGPERLGWQCFPVRGIWARGSVFHGRVLQLHPKKVPQDHREGSTELALGTGERAGSSGRIAQAEGGVVPGKCHRGIEAQLQETPTFLACQSSQLLLNPPSSRRQASWWDWGSHKSLGSANRSLRISDLVQGG
jgi:hypothetical protein